MTKVDPLLERAAEPTRDRLGRLVDVSENTGLMLAQISMLFLDTKETVTSMRRKAGVTEWHLKLFQRELGRPPQQLICECRLETTLQLLRDTTITFTQIADHVGYTRRYLEALSREWWDLSLTELRISLQQIRDDQRAKNDELLSWYFWVQLHRGEVSADAARAALNHLQDRFPTV